MLMVLGIHHPPCSNQSQTTNLDFSDEFTDWIAEHATNDKNVIMLGDFNLHVNGTNNDNAMNFIKTTQALALGKHIWFPTHTSSNMLDLVLTELFNGLKYSSVLWTILSHDHCIVRCNLTINRPDLTRKVTSYHKLKGINIQHMVNSINLDYDNDLNSLVEQLDKALSKALDEVAPIQTKLQTICKLIPWFRDEVKGCKQFMRWWEKIWRKYKTDSTKTAFINPFFPTYTFVMVYPLHLRYKYVCLIPLYTRYSYKSMQGFLVVLSLPEFVSIYI